MYAYVASTTTEPGPALDAVNYLKTHLGTQAVFVTVARGILRLLYELFARTVTTAMMFGVFESVRQILASTTVQSVWSFVSGSTIAEITIVRWASALPTLYISNFVAGSYSEHFCKPSASRF